MRAPSAIIHVLTRRTGVAVMALSIAVGAVGIGRANGVINANADSGVQKFYLHDATTTDTGTLPGASSLSTNTPDVIAAGASTDRGMDGTIGASQVTSTGGNNGNTQSDWMRRFVSAPLSAQTIAAGTWQFRAAIGTPSGPGLQSNVGVGAWTWRPSTGARITTIFDQTLGYLGIGNNSGVFDTGVVSISGAAATVQSGDILVVEVWIDGGDNDGFPTTVSFDYDGTTEGSTTSNAAYLNAPAAIDFISPATRSRTVRHPSGGHHPNCSPEGTAQDRRSCAGGATS